MKITRILWRTVTVALIFVSLFCAYGFTVVPLLEPPIQPEIWGAQNTPLKPTVDARLLRNFPPDAWERKPGFLMRTDNIVLFIDDLNVQEQGKIIRGKPCTILCYMDETGMDSTERDPLVIRIPEGIELRFPDGTNQTSMGRPVWGRTLGEVTLTSTGLREDPSDDTVLKARDIFYENGFFKTDSAVEFRFGAMTGKGEGIQIALSFSGETNPQKPSIASLFSGVRMIELRHLEYLRFLLTADMPGIPKSILRADGTLPVELTCSGTVVGDAEKQKLSFHDQVLVQSHYSADVKDRLTCDLLEVDFALPDSDVADSEHALGTPISATAFGQSVQFSSVKHQIYAKGTMLGVDLVTRKIRLEDINETVFRFPKTEFHGQTIDYDFLHVPETLGTVLVNGKGWLQTVSEGKSDTSSTFRLSWKNDMTAFPDAEGMYHLVVKDATLDSPKVGNLSAETLTLYLKKKVRDPNTPQSSQPTSTTSNFFQDWTPVKLQAGENVRFRFQNEKNQMEGELTEICLWFQEVAALPEAMRNSFSKTEKGTQTGTATEEPASPMPLTLPNHYQIQAGQLHGKMLFAQEEFGFSAIQLLGGITIQETTEIKPVIRRIYVKAEQVRLNEVAPTTLQVQILGQKAVLSGNGLFLQGNAINVNCGQNKIWMECPGVVQLARLPKTDPSQPVTTPLAPEITTLQWEDRFEFDGQKMNIRKNVCLRHPSCSMDAQNVQIQLSGRLDFTRLDTLDSAQIQENEEKNIESITASDRVIVYYCDKNTDTDIPKSLFKMEADSISASPLTGDVNVSGRIFMQYTSRFHVSQKNEKTTPAETVGEADTSEKLRRIDLFFNGTGRGNLYQGAFELERDITVIQDEIPDWNAGKPFSQDPLELKNGLIFKTEKLWIHEVPMFLKDKPVSTDSLELVAQGNISLETRLLSARAERLTFSNPKSQIILSGGTNKAQVHIHPTLETPGKKIEAGTIRYNTETEAISIDDFNTQSIQ